jgi:hypothetical protein
LSTPITASVSIALLVSSDMIASRGISAPSH